VGSKVLTLFHPRDHDRLMVTLAAAHLAPEAAAFSASLITTGGGTAPVELTARHADGATPPVDLLYVCAHPPSGPPLEKDDRLMETRKAESEFREPNRATVLICDDEARLGALTAGLLSEYGFFPVTVGTGEEALAAMARAEPIIDVVLLDVNLSEGWSANEVLIAMHERGNSARVVLTSGLAEEDVDTELVRHPSVVGYVAKPYGVDQLVQSIARAAATRPS
jgi:CheY-like chemotaxis protein